MADDPYSTLGVASDASDAEIKRAYRKLARQYHPDRNPGDVAAEERFKKIQSAHEQIGTPQERRKWDQQGRFANMFGGGGFPGGNPFGGGQGPGGVEVNFGGGSPGGAGGIEDIISSLFGGASGGSRGRAGGAPMGGIEDLLGGAGGFGGGASCGPGGCGSGGGQQAPPKKEVRGEDLHHTIELTIEQAGSGGKFPFGLSRLVRCKTCGGKGMGCGACQSQGVLRKSSQVKVNIPEKSEHGRVIRLKGLGHEHPKGPAGDLHLTIRIDPGEGRRWEDGRLLQEVLVPYSTLLLGGKVKLKTPDGKTVQIDVAPNTKEGDRRRLKGLGYLGGSLDIEFELNQPEELSDEQRKCVERLRELNL